MHNTRLRRANDAVLTEMARSLLREDRPARAGMERRPDPLQSDASAGRSAVMEADRVRHTARPFRREPSPARLRQRPLAAPPA
jgi:hypothetical protein